MAVQYIEMKIKIQDPHNIFFEIYTNYEQYNFINREYCKNYLLIIFQELYNQVIDLNIINCMSESKGIKRYDQANFRKKIVERFGSCVISGIDQESCQAAHIMDLKYDPLNFDANNGLLLSATLHMEYDMMKWAVNPQTYMIVRSEKYKDANLEINKYLHVCLTSLNSYPSMAGYLKKKYEIFLQTGHSDHLFNKDLVGVNNLHKK